MSNSTEQNEPAGDVIIRPGARLLSRDEVLDKVGVTYPTIWKLMCEGAFPRPVVVGRNKNGKNAWLEHEVDDFIARLPRRKLKGFDDGVAYHSVTRRKRAEAAA